MTDCTAAQVIKIVNEVKRTVTSQPRDSVLTLIDLTGAHVNRDAITRFKEVAVYDRPYVKRAAFLGADSLPKVYFEALKTFSRREFHRFNTREEAMDWLVKD